MQFVACVARDDTARLDVSRSAILRCAAVLQSLATGVGDQAASLIAEPPQDMPDPLGGPLRKRYARARNVCGGFVGRETFLL